MASDPTLDQRRLIAERAGHRCEYCLFPESAHFLPHQVDHIISRKHGGQSVLSNLALACIRCNSWKGSDIGSLDPTTGMLVPLFHPRQDGWSDHFRQEGVMIEPLTPTGLVTTRLLKLNSELRIAERRLLIALGQYPG